MPEATQPTSNDGQEPQEGTQEPQEPVSNDPQEPQDNGEGDLYEGLPEDHPVRKVISALRKENADRRTKAKDYEARVAELESQLENATELPQVKDLVQQFTDENKRLTIEGYQRDAITEHQLPASFASRLRGETIEEIMADAEALAQSLPASTPPAPPQAPPRGGRTPSKPPVTAESLHEQLKRQRTR